MEKLDTHNRALEVNLDPLIYGTFAEIGAGQEVARWFLQVGGASGTVAKTISAYDMKFSDEIYGRGSRYVSRERLLAMLDHEYDLLLERLDERRGDKTRFFVFADTVAARDYKGSNECHGWMGVRFQTDPRSEPSDILLHVNMLDCTNLLQQQALGILGVNMIYTMFFEREDPDRFLASLQHSLTLERIEIDAVEMRGPAFRPEAPYKLGISLVSEGLTQAVMFREDGTLVQPSVVIRKRPLIVERGMFKTTMPLHCKMLADASARLGEEIKCKREPLPFFEVTLRPVWQWAVPDNAEILRRLKELAVYNTPILLTSFPEAYHLTRYLRRYSKEAIRFVYGVSTLVQILQEAHYDDLVGGLLEALGNLFGDQVRLYAYPMQASAFHAALERSKGLSIKVRAPFEGLVTLDSIELDAPVQHLFQYLRSAGWIEPLDVTLGGNAC